MPVQAEPRPRMKASGRERTHFREVFRRRQIGVSFFLKPAQIVFVQRITQLDAGLGLARKSTCHKSLPFRHRQGPPRKKSLHRIIQLWTAPNPLPNRLQMMLTDTNQVFSIQMQHTEPRRIIQNPPQQVWLSTDDLQKCIGRHIRPGNRS